MSSAATKKVFIQVETAAEQQENLKNQRKTLKVLQGVATDKENLTGRTQLDKLSRLKAAAVHETTISTNTSTIDYAKRKKIETKSAETQTTPNTKSSNNKKITAEDLCSEENPGEHYWERLAEKRREALELSLEENQRLYERVEGLEEELNTTLQQLEEAKHLVTVLTEMLNEDETEEKQENAEETEVEGVTALAEDNDSNGEESDDSNATTSKAEN